MKDWKNIRIWRISAISLLLCLVVFICYMPIFSNGFLDSWDDQWMVMNVYTGSGWTWENLLAIFTQSHKGQYSPLVELNYLFLYGLFGYNPFWFHLMSVVWHCGCVVLCFFLVRRLLELSGDINRSISFHVACLVSFLFAIHPVNVESVAWISAVKVPMYTFFYLLALFFYLRYTVTQKTSFYVISLFCFVCSGLSKEQAFVFPLSLLLVDWFVLRDWKTMDIWLEKLPYLIVSIGFAFLTFDLQGNRSDAVSYTTVQRFLFGCYSLFEYITKSLIPVNLNYLYPFPIPEGCVNIPVRFYVYPVLVAGLVVTLLHYRKNRILLFGSLFFILHLLLSLHIVAMPRLGIVADRYLYLSLIGLLLTVSYAFVVFVKKQRRRFAKILCVLSLLLYSTYLGLYTYQYSMRWENTDTVKEYLRSFYKGELNENDIKSRDSHD